MHINFEENRLSQPRVVLFHDSIAGRGTAEQAPRSGASPGQSNGSAGHASSVELRPSQQRAHSSSDSSIFPYIPRKRQERSGLLIDYLYFPAAQETGDQVDFLILGENRVGVLLADVSGKVPEDSAPVLKTVLRSNSTGLSAAATLRHLEHCLKESCATGFSLTAFYAIFDQNKRLLHFASAGHLPMLVYRPSLGKTFLLNTPGAPLGHSPENPESAADSTVTGASKIESAKTALKQNDLLVLYSDGLLSTRGASGEYFGRQRLVEFIAEHGELEPMAFVRELRNLLERFTGGQSSNDDVTVIVLKNVLRDLEKQHPEARDAELAEKFMATDQEHAILEVLRSNPNASIEEILGRLAEREPQELTREQVAVYLEQNGRWLQPWPARQVKSGNGRLQQDQIIDHKAVAETAAKKFQEELIAAFPIRKLLSKRYEFRGDTPALVRALQIYNDGDYAQALHAFSKIRQTIKSSAAVHCFFGNLYLLLNLPARARQEFVTALDYDQRCSHAFLALGYLALLESDYNTAIESLATVLRLDGDLTEYRAFLGKLIAAVERRENRSEWLM